MSNQYNSLIKPVANIIKRGKKASLRNTVLKFPEAIGAHAVIMNFKAYEFRGRLNNTIVPSGSVVLPLPQSLSESFDVRLNGADMGNAGRVVQDMIEQGKFRDWNANQLGKDFGNAINNAMDGDSLIGPMQPGMAQFAPMARYIIRGGLDSVVPGAGVAIDTATGSAVNPHVAVNFDGMNLKSHTFAWQLAPSSPSESDTLRRIQNFIKRNVTPEYGDKVDSTNPALKTASRAILKYPSTVDIFFVGIEQSYFYYFKRCMVNNFAIDYTPQDGHTILTGGKPAFMNMTMNLTETQIHTQDDYEDE